MAGSQPTPIAIAVAIAVALVACGPAESAPTVADDAASPQQDARSSASDATTVRPSAAARPTVADEPTSSSTSPTDPADEVVVGGEGAATVVSDPFTTDGTLRGFVVEGSPSGTDPSQVALWLAEVGSTEATTLPGGCTGVSGEPPDLGVEDEAADASDGCSLLQVLSFEQDTGPDGGLGEAIPAGTWRIWAVPHGPVPPWRVTYRSCEDTVDAMPSLFVADELSGRFCTED